MDRPDPTAGINPARIVLITGAARRIGRAIALALAQDGWVVAVHVRSSRGDGEALAAEIRSAGGQAAVVTADLADPADVASLVPRATAAVGPLTCLVNNASEFHADDVMSLTSESWDRHLDVNLKAPVLLTQAFAAALPEGAAGNIVNIVDQRVLNPSPEFFSYAVSKAGLWSATRMLAQALAPRIRVNAVSPGPVLASVHQTAAEFEAERLSTLLGRGASPEEIAAAVRFILDAPALTGQMIALDGGQHLGGLWQAGSQAPPTLRA